MLIAKSEIRLIYEYSQYIDESFSISPLNYGHGNCPAILLSPELYRKVVLPVDMWIRQQCTGFGLHHCGVFDNYAELYTALCPTSIDVGGLSDYRKLRQHFPDTMCSYIINPESIEGQPCEAIDSVINNVITGGGPAEKITALRSYGISKHVTDQNLIDYRTSAIRQKLV
jgi:hypothetical protein